MSQIDIAWSGVVGKGASATEGGGRRCVRGMALLVVGTLAALFGPRAADAALVAAWSFNGFDPSTGPVAAASGGSGVLDCSGVTSGLGLMQGTTLGAQPGDIAGNALAVVGNASNGSSLRIDVAAGGFTDLMINFSTRRSTTGFATNRIELWNGTGWSTVTTFGASTTAWEWQSHSLASLGNPGMIGNPGGPGDGPLSLRIVIDGATGSTGSIRFDNLSVTGTAVPAPAGSLALLALAGCVSRRRR